MVLRGEMMATTTTRRPERPKNLHNFTLPSLRWGSRRHLKCTKIDGSTSSGDHRHRLRRRSSSLRFAGSSVPIREPEHRSSNDGNNNDSQRRRARFESLDDGGGEEEEEEGIEEFRVKIMSDLKTVRDKITQSMYALKEQHEEERKAGDDSGREKEVSPVVKKPWNLRKRRAAAACKEAVEERTVNPPSPPPRNDSTRVMKERGGVVEAETTTMMRPKFSVSLSKKEIEEDFMAALGQRPPRRPKKRPRTVQKKLDSLYPGFYLTEVTLDAYKVPEETKV
ncbi:uncharacterized protein LOC108819517 [Raphanus sativus]|uniref:Uncharacterized protein LOC108819517 n=1 Tax=Raphanus sativus TaxID=3726 RepID=A0A6J0KJM2_RAPSA|nr:uncharacterized protein LOC108819517 [Raphanus sativus]